MSVWVVDLIVIGCLKMWHEQWKSFKYAIWHELNGARRKVLQGAVCICVSFAGGGDNDCAGGEWNTRVYFLGGATLWLGRPPACQLIPSRISKACVICKFAPQSEESARCLFLRPRRKHTPHSISHTRTAHSFNIIIMAAVVFVLRFIHLQHKSSKTKKDAGARVNIKRSVSDSSQIPPPPDSPSQIYLPPPTECMRLPWYKLRRQESSLITSNGPFRGT